MASRTDLLTLISIITMLHKTIKANISFNIKQQLHKQLQRTLISNHSHQLHNAMAINQLKIN